MFIVLLMIQIVGILPTGKNKKLKNIIIKDKN